MADVNTIRKKIENNENIKEPINEILRKIAKSNDNVLVLKGARGSGRTTVLLELEKSPIGPDTGIYHHFDHTGLGVTSKAVGLDFIKHRYELEMASVLVQFLMSRRGCAKRTEIIKEELKELRSLFIYDINSLGINDSFKSTIVSFGHYTEDLIKEIRNVYSPRKLLFLVDRFDWMFNFSPEAQRCIQEYFKLFDQVILTTDDINYSSKYPTIDVNYGERKEVIKEIIKKYIEIKNIDKRKEEKIDFSFITEETFDYIVDISNGDIEVMLRAINKLCNYFDSSPEEELNNSLKNELDVQVLRRIELKKINIQSNTSPRFYI